MEYTLKEFIMPVTVTRIANIHYFEFPSAGVVTFTEKEYDKLMQLDELFCRKVRSGISDKLLDAIDEVTE